VPPHAEVEAPLAEVIERRHLAGQAQGMVEGQELHGGPRAQALGPGDDPARHQQRRREYRARGIDQHLGQPHDVEPPPLPGVGHVEHLAKSPVLIHAPPRLLQEHTEIHRAPLSPIG
jgi:hypothetical protein